MQLEQKQSQWRRFRFTMCCWRSGSGHSAVPERARFTHSDEEETCEQRLKRCMKECKHMIEEYTDSGYYTCQHATHVWMA